MLGQYHAKFAQYIDGLQPGKTKEQMFFETIENTIDGRRIPRPKRMQPL